MTENTEFSLYVYLKEETFERYYQATQDEDAADEYDEWLEAFNNLDWFTVLDDVLCIIPIYNKENTEFIPLRGSVEEQLRLQSRYEKWLENNHKE